MKKLHVILLCLIIAAATVAITLTIVFAFYRPEEPASTEDQSTTEEETTERDKKSETTVEVPNLHVIPPDEITLPEIPEGTPKETLWRTIGSVVSFGTYEQDNNISNGTESIEWIIIDVDEENDTVLLISKLCLDFMPYEYVDMSEGYDQSKDAGSNWVNSSLREWLNNTFYQLSFSNDEKGRMIKMDLESSLSDFDNATILTSKEAEKYIVDNKLPLEANTTPYAVTHHRLTNGYNGMEYTTKLRVSWWLRNKETSNETDYVDSDGSIVEDGALTCSPAIALRPVIKVKLS